MEEKQREKKQAKKHLWKPEEDLILKKYVETHGEGNWATVSLQSGSLLITLPANYFSLVCSEFSPE
ncbi:hypothetical protein TIFTF001_029048 [Ficus carica]|uniref:Uncharacterized protein n=1 Tax=Ficus carica TaxID=3494 RepID=A0AA88DR28_FICCA|nr:hypothetical protein TIFTF001_029048 [Ficus carica]